MCVRFQILKIHGQADKTEHFQPFHPFYRGVNDGETSCDNIYNTRGEGKIPEFTD